MSRTAFFLKSNFFDKLCGTEQVRLIIEVGKSDKEIRKFYEDKLEKYKLIRKKYLIYKD